MIGFLTGSGVLKLEGRSMDEHCIEALNSAAVRGKSGEITRLLRAWRDGEPGALDELLPRIYADLRRLAARHLAQERPEHTLQPTALVHEVFLRLLAQRRIEWHGRRQFFALAARLTRRVLLDHARARKRAKRGGGRSVPLEPWMVGSEAPRGWDLLALEEALRRLADLDARKERLVSLRFFAGLTVAEAAAVLGISPATAKREWAMARAWLRSRLDAEAEP